MHTHREGENDIIKLDTVTGPTKAESPKDVSVQVQAAMDQQGPLRFLAVPEFHACKKLWNEGPLPKGKLEPNPDVDRIP